MKIFHKVLRMMSDGECTIAGRIHQDDDPTKEQLAAHGETAFCTCGGPHTKACASALLDLKPVLSPAVPESKDPDTGETILAKDAVLGKSIREKIKEWADAWDALPDDPTHVKLPTKTEVVVEGGKKVKREVEDRDLS